MFAGTNAVFRKIAIDAIGGFVYGSQTEDCLTGERLHALGFTSVYVRRDKRSFCGCVGGCKAPLCVSWWRKSIVLNRPFVGRAKPKLSFVARLADDLS